MYRFCRLQSSQHACSEWLGTVQESQSARLQDFVSEPNLVEDISEITFDDLKVGHQCLFKDGMPKDAPLGDISHQQLDDYGELMDSLVKSRCELGWRCPSDSLLQICMCSTVVELHRAYTAQEVVVPGELGISSGRREGGFGHKFVSLVIEVVMEVVAENAIDQRRLTIIIVSQSRCPLGRQEEAVQRTE